MFQRYRQMRKLEGPRKMSAASFWSECGIKVINWLCTVIVLAMILSAALPLPVAELTRIVEYTALAMALLWLIPIARNTRYRLRDAGYGPKAYLWLLLPLIGWLIFIVLMFAGSKPVE